MIEFYQTEWYGISFGEVTEVSEHRIADEKFYAEFYNTLFHRYAGWDQLDSGWRAGKKAVAALISGRLGDRDQTVLSVGCGLGMVEHYLRQGIPQVRLDVLETTAIPLRWLIDEMDPACVHVGYFPQCLPLQTRYDLIYLSAVDYCFDRTEWRELLQRVGDRLNPSGRCLVISASLQQNPDWVEVLRSAYRALLTRMGLRQRRQLWGYLRTVADYHAALNDAGFPTLQDGYLADGTYWIEGRM